MITNELMTQALILLLLIDSAVVVTGLYLKKNMWPLIVAYWFFLTLKNLSDLLMGAMK